MAEGSERGALDLPGRTAFVTGAASGIGHALARALWDEGMSVVVADRDAAKLAEAVAAFPGADRIMPVTLDVTDRAAFAAARDATLQRFGRIDLVANIAGVGGGASIEQADFNDWDWVLGVNLGGVVNSVVTLLPALRANPGGAMIVNMGSILSTFPQPGPPGIYGVTKAAVLALSDSLRWSLQGTGVRVATVCPGYVDTAIARSEEQRPPRFPITSPRDPEHQAFFERILKESGASADEVARRIVDGIKSGRPYIMTHAEFRGAADAYWASVLAGYGDAGAASEGQLAAGSQAEEAMRALIGHPSPS
jgi:NAD(P)-dependent dehydrogenase (short-subunit alcohol dehydrogenase family)